MIKNAVNEEHKRS